MSEFNFIFGLGIFLFGMAQLEFGIRKLSDVRLRQILRNSTGSRLGSVATGIVTTAILQSSSMVSLLVLAFASAGLLPLVNAIGIILGANLGTTFTGWVVALFGFKLDLEAMALPLFGVTAFLMAIAKRDSRVFYGATAIFGLALLLFGLGIMKTSMEALPQRWDISLLQGHHPAIYLLFGVIITMLIQSSSAAMMMALASLNAEFIALPEAVALIIGADLGTTSTTVLGSLTGSTIKRQLAFAHFIFNFIVDIAAFIFLLPLLPTLMALLSLEDPLYSLVAFHSIMNLLGLFAFVPALGYFSNWIERVFARVLLKPTSLLERVSPAVVDAALVVVKDTVRQLILQAACNSLFLFGLKPQQLQAIDSSREQVLGSESKQDFDEDYEELKNQEGNVLRYSTLIQAQPLQPEQAVQLERLQTIIRHVIFSNKNLKDILQDLKELKYSNSSSMRQLYEKHREYHRQIYEQFISLLLGEHSVDYILEELNDIQDRNEHHTEESNKFVQQHVGRVFSDGDAISIQFNVNREVRHAVKTLIKAMDLWARLDQDADPLDWQGELPVDS